MMRHTRDALRRQVRPAAIVVWIAIAALAALIDQASDRPIIDFTREGPR